MILYTFIPDSLERTWKDDAVYPGTVISSTEITVFRFATFMLMMSGKNDNIIFSFSLHQMSYCLYNEKLRN